MAVMDYSTFFTCLSACLAVNAKHIPSPTHVANINLLTIFRGTLGLNKRFILFTATPTMYVCMYIARAHFAAEIVMSAAYK